MPMSPAQKQLRTPPGCDGYLTRRQAARELGFASEFKVRAFERDGLLHAVRGPMRAAFYPRAEVIALKARLAGVGLMKSELAAWSDADLLALLGLPKSDGGGRTALDLVLETGITIERGEQVVAFFQKCAAEVATTPRPSAPATPAEVSAKTSAERRSPARRHRDELIQELRHPDPAVRDQAFRRLKREQSSTGT